MDDNTVAAIAAIVRGLELSDAIDERGVEAIVGELRTEASGFREMANKEGYDELTELADQIQAGSNRAKVDRPGR
jgi:hypothetical protein